MSQFTPFVFLLAIGRVCVGPEPTSHFELPNIILIVTDDQGYGDMSCHGNPILKTPHLDRLYAESLRFTDFHVSPTCSPTRAALMTGKHEFRSGVTHTIMERERLRLDEDQILPHLFGGSYTGIFGKWHLGDEPEYQPNRRGFGEVFIHGAGGIGQSYPGSCGDAPGNSYFNPWMLHNGKFKKTHGYCTDVIFQAAISWIAEKLIHNVKEYDQRFFVYIPTNAPHAPLDVPPEYEQLYAGKVPPRVAKFYGMIKNIDDNVGRLMSKLKDWGIEKNTLVIFMNDNGGTAGVPVFNAGMRGQKVTPFLGGTRAASFWRWPGTLQPGDCDKLVAHIDVYPTFAEMVPGGSFKKVDGRSLVPLLKDRHAQWEDRVLFTHVGRWPKGQAKSAKYMNCSVRNTKYQMVCSNKEHKKAWMLFDVKADPGEKQDIAAQHPEVVKLLEEHYDRWWDSIQPDLVNEDAVGPHINPFRKLFFEQIGN